MFVSSLVFRVVLCPYVTAAVRGGSLRASRAWSQRPKFVQGSLESVERLGPPFPPPFFLSSVFLNEILRITPLFLGCVPGRLFVAGNTFLSSPFLSLSLSFFPSLFPLFTLFPGCPWMLRHSWEPFLLVCPWTHVS